MSRGLGRHSTPEVVQVSTKIFITIQLREIKRRSILRLADENEVATNSVFRN